MWPRGLRLPGLLIASLLWMSSSSQAADGGARIDKTEAEVQQLQKDVRKDNRDTQKQVQAVIVWSRQADPPVDSGVRSVAQQGGSVEEPDPKATPNAARKTEKP